MAKIDLVKEKINYLKVWLGIFVVTLIGLVGWLASNFEQMNTTKFTLALFAIFVMVIFVHTLNKWIMQKINSLEDLQHGYFNWLTIYCLGVILWL